jgi:hypothetical protein
MIRAFQNDISIFEHYRTDWDLKAQNLDFSEGINIKVFLKVELAIWFMFHPEKITHYMEEKTYYLKNYKNFDDYPSLEQLYEKYHSMGYTNRAQLIDCFIDSVIFKERVPVKMRISKLKNLPDSDQDFACNFLSRVCCNHYYYLQYFKNLLTENQNFPIPEYCYQKAIKNQLERFPILFMKMILTLLFLLSFKDLMGSNSIFKCLMLWPIIFLCFVLGIFDKWIYNYKIKRVGKCLKDTLVNLDLCSEFKEGENILYLQDTFIDNKLHISLSPLMSPGYFFKAKLNLTKDSGFLKDLVTEYKMGYNLYLYLTSEKTLNYEFNSSEYTDRTSYRHIEFYITEYQVNRDFIPDSSNETKQIDSIIIQRTLFEMFGFSDGDSEVRSRHQMNAFNTVKSFLCQKCKIYSGLRVERRFKNLCEKAFISFKNFEKLKEYKICNSDLQILIQDKPEEETKIIKILESVKVTKHREISREIKTPELNQEQFLRDIQEKGIKIFNPRAIPHLPLSAELHLQFYTPNKRSKEAGGEKIFTEEFINYSDNLFRQYQGDYLNGFYSTKLVNTVVQYESTVLNEKDKEVRIPKKICPPFSNNCKKVLFKGSHFNRDLFVEREIASTNYHTPRVLKLYSNEKHIPRHEKRFLDLNLDIPIKGNEMEYFKYKSKVKKSCLKSFYRVKERENMPELEEISDLDKTTLVYISLLRLSKAMCLNIDAKSLPGVINWVHYHGHMKRGTHLGGDKMRQYFTDLFELKDRSETNFN